MRKYKTIELARILNGRLVGDGGGKVDAVSIDTRTLKGGECFFAIRGENFDGHEYVEAAFDKGVVCCVVSRDFEGELQAGQSVIVVDDTVLALGDLARCWRSDFAGKVVGITGSVGKTTTREIINHVLSGLMKCHCAKKSFNNQIGLPLSMLAANEGHEVMVVELGSNNPGEIEYLTNIAKPDVAVVTTVGQAHLEGFGDFAGVVREKASIAKGLTGSGKLIINGDLPELAEETSRYPVERISFGESSVCDIVADEMICEGLAGKVVINGREFNVGLAGRGNLQNVLCAWAVCSELGVSIDDFANRIEGIKPADMRLEVLKIGAVRVICDCYNANPTSMANAIDCLAGTKGSGRSVFICGHMGELGSQSEMLHAQLGEKIARAGVDVLLCCGEHSQIVLEKAVSLCGGRMTAKSFADTAALCDNLDEFVKADDTILIKGSRSAGLEKSLDRLREIFTGK